MKLLGKIGVGIACLLQATSFAAAEPANNTRGVIMANLSDAALDETLGIDRIQRHRQMGETHIRAHQAMTEAHIAGQEVVSRESLIRPGVRVFMPQTGERVVQNSIYGKQDPVDGSLKELRMFWKRIPDFGIKEYTIFPNDSGWIQVQKWAGIGEDGNIWTAEEAGYYQTDAEFNVTYVEIYSDTSQWMAVAAYANGRDPATFTPEDYFDAVAGS